MDDCAQDIDDLKRVFEEFANHGVYTRRRFIDFAWGFFPYSLPLCGKDLHVDYGTARRRHNTASAFSLLRSRAKKAGVDLRTRRALGLKKMIGSPGLYYVIRTLE
jgi:hypothetical protein